MRRAHTPEPGPGFFIHAALFFIIFSFFPGPLLLGFRFLPSGVEKNSIENYYSNMSNTSSLSDIIGKKTFFLHPTVVVQNKIIEELVQQEYEVYMTRNHASLLRVLKKYPDSIVFVDINEQLSEPEWEKWITELRNTAETKEILIGIVTAHDNEELRQKYTHTIGIQGGYILLKSDLNIATRQIIEVLNAADAKGRRKYLRVTTDNDIHTTINLPLNNNYINGFIKDVSVVGISCAFDGDPEIVRNTLFRDIQVKLQSMLINVEGIVFGSRVDGNSKIYVILFTQRIDPVARTKIRKYIQQNLQTKMDVELK